MTIVFICGSLEPGKDGVGDYTRLLAAETIMLGHKAVLLALFDRDILEIYSEKQRADESEIETVRIPFNCKQKQRESIAKSWIEKINPDWISLQYVAFSFDKKGLPFYLENYLYQLGSGRKWNIMFHELWVGMEKKTTYKLRIWGWLQKRLISRLIIKLKPDLVFTQTHLYQSQLKKMKIQSYLLPLFSNIPLLTTEYINLEQKALSKDDLTIVFVLFGGIHYGAPVKQFANELAQFSKKNARPVKIIFCGRNGNEQINWIEELDATSIITEVIGPLSSEKLSLLFLSADFGISTTPIFLLEKSGSIAAMREHQLPVINVAREWIPDIKMEKKMPTGIFEYVEGNLKSWIWAKKYKDQNIGVAVIAKQFVTRLLSV